MHWEDETTSLGMRSHQRQNENLQEFNIKQWLLFKDIRTLYIDELLNLSPSLNNSVHRLGVTDYTL